MSSPPSQTVISLMVAVPDARAATEWYTRVLGAGDKSPLQRAEPR